MRVNQLIDQLENEYDAEVVVEVEVSRLKRQRFHVDVVRPEENLETGKQRYVIELGKRVKD